MTEPFAGVAVEGVWAIVQDICKKRGLLVKPDRWQYDVFLEALTLFHEAHERQKERK